MYFASSGLSITKEESTRKTKYFYISFAKESKMKDKTGTLSFLPVHAITDSIDGSMTE